MHFNESNKYLIPYKSARFLAPRCLLYRLRAEIRSTLFSGVTCIKDNPQKQWINQIPNSPPWPRQRAVQVCQGQDCRPTQGWNGLQDHRQAAWWWRNYSQMEETQNNCQSPSDWGSMQDLTSWSFNDHEIMRTARNHQESNW